MGLSHCFRHSAWQKRFFILALCSLGWSLASSMASGQPLTRIPTSATLGGTAQQNSTTVGRALIRAANFIGFSFLPTVGALFIIFGAFSWFHGRHHGRYFLVAVLCLVAPGITRLIEFLVRSAGR